MFAIWLVLTTILVIGFLTVSVESATGSDVPIPPARPITTQIEPEAPAPNDLYPSVTYAGLTWSMVSARTVTPVGDAVFGGPIVVAEVIVTNESERATLRAREADVALVWPDGRREPVSRFDQIGSARRLVLEPGRVTPITLVFKPGPGQAPELGELALEIGEAGRIPARLPLEGPVEGDGYPIEAQMDSEPAVLADPDNEGRQLVISPRIAGFDVETGLYRAAVDERVAVITVSVQRTVFDDEAAYVQPEFWRLEVDGRPVPPVRIDHRALDSANEDEVELVFVVNAAAQRMILIAGDDDRAHYPVVPASPLDTDRGQLSR